MINLRVAWILAHEIHGTPWESECLRKNLDPASATADDVLGPMNVRMTYGGGKQVLPYDDDLLADVLEELEAEEPITIDPRRFVAEVTEIACLTKAEKRVVSAIVDGSPIPDGKQYTGPLAKRLNTTTGAVQRTWSRAKKKLRDTWAAE